MADAVKSRRRTRGEAECILLLASVGIRTAIVSTVEVVAHGVKTRPRNLGVVSQGKTLNEGPQPGENTTSTRTASTRRVFYYCGWHSAGHVVADP